jgi:hypothetical protein
MLWILLLCVVTLSNFYIYGVTLRISFVVVVV